MLSVIYQVLCLFVTTKFAFDIYKKCKKYNKFAPSLNSEQSECLEDDKIRMSKKRYHYRMYNFYNSRKKEI